MSKKDEAVEVEIATVSKKLEKLPIKEDLAEPQVELQSETQKRSIETKVVEEDEITNKKDQKIPLVNSEDQIIQLQSVFRRFKILNLRFFFFFLDKAWERISTRL
jgi:hypothetical protein